MHRDAQGSAAPGWLSIVPDWLHGVCGARSTGAARRGACGARRRAAKQGPAELPQRFSAVGLRVRGGQAGTGRRGRVLRRAAGAGAYEGGGGGGLGGRWGWGLRRAAMRIAAEASVAVGVGEGSRSPSQAGERPAAAVAAAVWWGGCRGPDTERRLGRGSRGGGGSSFSCASHTPNLKCP